MVEYLHKYHKLVKKPQVSAWICNFKRQRLILSCVLFSLFIGLTVQVVSRYISLVSIQNLHTSIGEFMDFELKYLEKSKRIDGWKETTVYQGHIFSAYLDTRPEVIIEERHAVNKNEVTWAMIRIIAILDMELTDAPLICVYKYEGKNRSEDPDSFVLTKRRATRVKPIAEKENFGMRYNAFFILCDLTISDGLSNEDFYKNGHLPYEITIAPGNLTDVDLVRNDSFVPIHYSENGISMADYSNDLMAVCVQTFHHNFDRVLNLVEFIEFYLMMGAGHFTFYNGSMSSGVSEVLDYYRNKGVATILPWELPPYFIYEKTLRVEGIFAALNDCLYRSSFHKSYTYVAGVDVDEFIVPRQQEDFFSMMKHLDPKRPDRSINNQASFIFRNMFFYLMYEDDPVTLPSDIPKLYTHSKTERWTLTNPPGQRSKFIVRSRQTVELGNHNTWEMMRTASAFGGRYLEVPVDVEVAASQHYRACETHEETCWFRPTVRDRTAHKFTKELGNRVAVACKNIFKNGCPAGTKNHPN